VSAIGLGTWQFGSREWGYGDGYAEGVADHIVERAIDLGINLIDTAEVYAFGRSERIVGRAIAGRRDEVFVATKVFPIAPLPPVIVQRGKASRRRLGIDVIDLYQIHQYNPLVPARLQLAGMRRLRDQGVIRHIGVSNYSLTAWQAADDALGGPVLSNQVQFSLAAAGPARHMVPWAAANDRIVIAYSPLGQGVLSGRFDGTNTPTGVRAFNPLFLPENLDRAKPLIDALREIAEAHDARPSQIALAWLLHRPNVVAIPGASSVAQLEQNAAAADIELTEDEDHRLSDASDDFRPVRGAAAMPKMARRRLTHR
jgi:aryl-alcohol dehydrogenase-like predicted oxidoreductase